MKKQSDLIGYCGLFCGDCYAYKGILADLSRDLRKELRQSKFKETAAEMAKIPYFKSLENFHQCYEVLGTLVRFRCKKACRGGGGDPNCKIRKCCIKKNLKGCWECSEFNSCKKLDFLKTLHGQANIKNLKNIKKNGVDKFLKGKKHWYSK